MSATAKQRAKNETPEKIASLRKTPKQPSIDVNRLIALARTNSLQLPQVINDDGRRKRWVGIGWVDEGLANGTEDAKVRR